MKWKSYKENKPEQDILAIVCNEKGWMSGVKALYYSHYDVWNLYDPNYKETLLLDVTHYIEIPQSPRAELC